MSKLRFQLMCFAARNDQDLYLHDAVTDRDGDSSLNISRREKANDVQQSRRRPKTGRYDGECFFSVVLESD